MKSRKTLEIDEAIANARCARCGIAFTPTRKQVYQSRDRENALYCSPAHGRVGGGKTGGSKNRGAKRSDAYGDEISLRELGKPQPLDSLMGKAEHNVLAKMYCLESPDRVRYTFRNLRHFVRTNPSLFDEASLQVRTYKIHNKRRAFTSTCNAVAGLGRLFTESRHQIPQWRGWRGVWKKEGPRHFEWLVWKNPNIEE